MWNATLQKVTNADSSPSIKINYHEDLTGETAFEQFDISPVVTSDFLAQKAKNKIEYLTARKNNNDLLADGPITPKDILVVTEPIDPDLLAFQKNLAIYRQTQKAFDMGLVIQSDLDIAKSELQKVYNPSFLNLL